ncbi:hypothetical protein OBBRIDRAFT_361688 [Obba rivulosa]|uniref:BRCT domain-containing protein n=1 Tax=Obba rivulosa TaxID=1052685 RepID=A0A8E2J702_9APHY|nr:hypothetical protein OBBRIDRAFT_361688 [Obba rivulosa]
MDASGSPGPAFSQSVQAHPHLFQDRNEQPLQVFVEASGITFRPKLIRLLRTGGASICLSPSHAQIILVDPDSEEGRKFIADWASVPHKVVLDTIWARRSAERGQVFLADEGWGGFVLSTSSVNVVENGNVNGHQSPLPTPRQTPSDAGPSHFPTTNASTSSIQHAYIHQSTNGSMLPIAQNISTAIPTQTQMALGTSQAILFPQAFALSNQAMSPNNVPPEVWALLGNYARQMTSNAAPAQVSPDLLQGQNVPNAGSVLPTYAQATQVTPSSHITQDIGPSSIPRSISAVTHDVPRSSRTPDDRQRSYTPMGSMIPPSIKRNRSEFESPSYSRSKGKERDSPEPPLAKIGRRDSTPSRRDSPDFSTPPSFQRRPSAYLGQGESNVFMKDGQALQFVVQIDTRNRKDIIQTVKAGGGRIIAEIEKADYVVLNPSSHSFHQLLDRTENCQKPAIMSQFVFDCADEQKLLDPDDYGFSGHVPKAKRGRPSNSSSSTVDKGKKKTDSEKVGTPASKSSTKREAKKEKDRDKDTQRSGKSGHSERGASKQKVKKDKEKAKGDTSTLSPLLGLTDEPSPPPPDKVVRYMEGKNLYSEEDRNYFSRYLLILLRRDPDMTNSAIADKMHQKMPHHSTPSWNAFIGHKKLDIEAARKKALIAWRKAIYDQQRSQQAQSSSMAEPRRTSTRSVDPPSRPPSAILPRKSDFDLLTEFLAGGGADSRTDEEVWEEMARLHPTRNSTGWRALWDEQGLEINEAVQKLTDQQRHNATSVANGQQLMTAGTFVGAGGQLYPSVKTEVE